MVTAQEYYEIYWKNSGGNIQAALRCVDEIIEKIVAIGKKLLFFFHLFILLLTFLKLKLILFYIVESFVNILAYS